MAWEAWEEQPSAFCYLVEYIQEMHEWIDRVIPIVRKQMEAIQQDQ